ncbi:MAG TPA: polysaccharide biosynthesis/export family protein [Bryobacteraceae bacterium]|nr:polysaccharide biosynthesis/export family protein [Bryobacteraceae bacterium]
MLLSRVIAVAAWGVLCAQAQRESVPNPCPDVTGATASYVIGSLDVLEIRIWENDKLSATYPVRPDGMISMPLAGEIRAAGLTVEEFREAVKTRLKDFMIDPTVNIQVARVNSKNFYIEGEVVHTGEFPLIRNLTVLDALSSAGGFREFAKRNKIYVLRGAQLFRFDYNKVSRGKHMEQNIQILNEDHIIVPEH